MEKLGRPMGSTKARRSSAAVRGCRVSSKGAILVLMLVLRREGSLGPLERKSERGDLDRRTSGTLGGTNPPSHGTLVILYRFRSCHSFDEKKGRSQSSSGREGHGG